ncbi:hypothetical protein [Roseburia inulinivorans]
MMMEAKGVARLYRAMDEKDSKILTSADTNILSMHSMNGEILSHEMFMGNAVMQKTVKP